eukprot:gene8991-1323_t
MWYSSKFAGVIALRLTSRTMTPFSTTLKMKMYPTTSFAPMRILPRYSSSNVPSSPPTSSKESVPSLPSTPPQIDIRPTNINTSPETGSALTGTPVEQLQTRRVRISIPTRNVMQSGEEKLDTWVLNWDTNERWENPLMGWISTADPLSNVNMKFSSKEEAIGYCERNGWTYYVHEPSRRRRMKKNYGNNFSWDKRTRKNTK